MGHKSKTIVRVQRLYQVIKVLNHGFNEFFPETEQSNIHPLNFKGSWVFGGFCSIQV